MKSACYKCNTELEFSDAETISRNEECPKCYASLRSCNMCQFYDQNSYNECREPTADRIVDKEKANFCDHYKIHTGQKYEDTKSNALSAAEALFKK